MAMDVTMIVAGGARAVGHPMLETKVPGEAGGTLTVDLDHVQGRGTGGGRVTLPGGQGLTAGPDLAPSHHIWAARAKAGTDHPTRSLMKAVKSLEANRQSDFSCLVPMNATVLNLCAPSEIVAEIATSLSSCYLSSPVLETATHSCFFRPAH